MLCGTARLLRLTSVAFTRAELDAFGQLLQESGFAARADVEAVVGEHVLDVKNAGALCAMGSFGGRFTFYCSQSFLILRLFLFHRR